MPIKTIKDEMTEDDLKATHELYEAYEHEWRFLNAAYEGVRALVEWGVLTQHERESDYNYARRVDEAYGYSYSKSIVDILNSYLFKKDYPRTIPPALASDPQWLLFMDDCNLEGSEFDEFFIDQQKQASIQGHVGILVDKPNFDAENMAEEKLLGVYPYVAAYKSTAILDWEWERDKTGRKRLVYLKLLDDDERYLIWTPEKWQVWEILQKENAVPEVKSAETSREKVGMAAKLIDQGENILKEIPFVWLYNERSTVDKEVGKSDVNDVARIDSSIIRNMSQIEEIVNYAAFPMMRKPYEEAGKGGDQKDESGPTAVLEYDPELGEAGKPDWLEAKCEGPVKATLEVVAKKIEEIYRSSNVGGMASTEISTSPKSGAALKVEFQLLNSKLVKKGKNVVKAKRAVVDYWLKWQGQYEKMKEELEFQYVKTFEVEDLMGDLENILTGKAIVTDSPTFTNEMQKTCARLLIPSSEDELLAMIDEEIDSGLYASMGGFFGEENYGEEGGEEGELTGTTTTEPEEEGEFEDEE